MAHHLFQRNVKARDNLELFLVSAVSSLLLLRLFLSLSGYPQVGGGSFHIAHMLWGGLFMMGAIVLAVSFIGSRVLRLSAFLGGVGFGVFIDELGKFITKDNNYFFRPTIGIIYALFMCLYFAFNFLSRPTRYTKLEYQLNALYQFEEAVLRDMDALEKARLERLLKRADQDSPITSELINMLKRIELVDTPMPNRFEIYLDRLNDRYRHFWNRRNTSKLIGTLFVLEAIVFTLSIFANLFNNVDDVPRLLTFGDSYTNDLIVGQLASSLVAVTFAIIGAYELTQSRLKGFEYFRRATLVNLLLTEFFIFSRIQLGAIPSFAANLVLLLALRYAIYQEQRSRTRPGAKGAA